MMNCVVPLSHDNNNNNNNDRKASRKHSLSPERSPTPGLLRDSTHSHSHTLEEDDQSLERSIKKLKIDTASHANVPVSRPLNKRFPNHVDAQDHPDYMHDINFPEVNKVLNELAIIREFREKVKRIRQSNVMPTISENVSYDSEPNTHFANSSAAIRLPQSFLDFSSYHSDHSDTHDDGSSSPLEPMDMDATADDDYF